MIDIDKIKKLAIIAMASNDYLMEQLVLKGGNAIDIVYQLSGRASIDLDYSIPSDFKNQGTSHIADIIQGSLSQTFLREGLSVFDFKMEEKPPNPLQKDEISFWGGYQIEFKLIETDILNKPGTKPERLHKISNIVGPNNRRVFKIDIGKYEYCSDKVEKDIDGYIIYVYSSEMMVLEKLRAICQQIPEYREIVKSHPPVARARDFFDIYVITQKYPIDMNSQRIKDLLSTIFAVKKVPLDYLNRVSNYRNFHKGDFSSVKDTIKSGVELKEFDFYFDYVINLVNTAKN